MVVGVCRIALLLPGCNSLKEKRSVVKRVLGRVRSRFNVAAAEVGDLDVHANARLGFAVVGSEQVIVRGVLERVIDFIEEQYLGEVVSEEIEVEHYGS